ncbi:MAG: hypothetical protein AAFX99_32910, partial [Myxococcota bacterium]
MAATGVNIGSVAGAGVDGCIFDAQEVTITIGVRGANESGEYVVLSGRQRIQPVPFSYWAAESSDIRVDGTALITGDLSVNDAEGMNLGLADLHVSKAQSGRPTLWAGEMTLDSEDNSGLVNVVAGAHSVGGGHVYNGTRGASRIALGDGDMAIHLGGSSDNNRADNTSVTWTEMFNLNTNRLNLTGNLNINGTHNLNVTGNINADGNINVDGNINSDGDIDIRGGLFNGSTGVSHVNVNDGLFVTNGNPAILSGNVTVGGVLLGNTD